MLQRDYFIRLIEEFNAAISRFLTKKDDELKRDKDLKDLYRQYVGEYDDLRNLSVDELLTYAKEQWKEEERIDKINMVAELLYAEGNYKGQPLRQILLEKHTLYLIMLRRMTLHSLSTDVKRWRLCDKS